jgi:hypothetical protein
MARQRAPLFTDGGMKLVTQRNLAISATLKIFVSFGVEITILGMTYWHDYYYYKLQLLNVPGNTYVHITQFSPNENPTQYIFY